MDFQPLKQEYEDLYKSMQFNDEHWVYDASQVAKKIIDNKSTYTAIQDQTTVPWWVVGIIHHLEADCNFKCHLHNGDPLEAPTVQEPKGRPNIHWRVPPGTFIQSAVDAIKYDKLDKNVDWSIAKVLYYCELFNGFGYRKYKHINSPYLWSGCQHYTRGKYVSDGHWSSTAKSEQIGAALVIKQLLITDPTIKAH